MGLSLSSIAFIAVPISAIWMLTGLILGKKQDNILKEVKAEQGVISEKGIRGVTDV